jgi:hypothetical protein
LFHGGILSGKRPAAGVAADLKNPLDIVLLQHYLAGVFHTP